MVLTRHRSPESSHLVIVQGPNTSQQSVSQKKRHSVMGFEVATAILHVRTTFGLGRVSRAKLQNVARAGQTAASYPLLLLARHPENGHAQPSTLQRIQQEETSSDYLWWHGDRVVAE